MPNIKLYLIKKTQIETLNVVIDTLGSCLGHTLHLFGVLFVPSDSQVIDKSSTLSSALERLGPIHFRSYIRSDRLTVTPMKRLKTILNCGLQSTFPNVYIVVRLYLTFSFSSCEGEDEK